MLLRNNFSENYLTIPVVSARDSLCMYHFQKLLIAAVINNLKNCCMCTCSSLIRQSDT